MPVIHLRIVGKVQGVGFRWFVREKAARLGIAGWVRNTPSGDVEVEASGDETQLEQLTAAVQRGPEGARVTEVQRMTPTGDASYPYPFRIER